MIYLWDKVPLDYTEKQPMITAWERDRYVIDSLLVCCCAYFFSYPSTCCALVELFYSKITKIQLATFIWCVCALIKEQTEKILSVQVNRGKEENMKMMNIKSCCERGFASDAMRILIFLLTVLLLSFFLPFQPDAHSCRELHSKSHRFALQNFQQVISTEEFLLLGFNEVINCRGSLAN